jgi:hypothetical protein
MLELYKKEEDKSYEAYCKSIIFFCRLLLGFLAPKEGRSRRIETITWAAAISKSRLLDGGYCTLTMHAFINDSLLYY